MLCVAVYTMNACATLDAYGKNFFLPFLSFCLFPLYLFICLFYCECVHVRVHEYVFVKVCAVVCALCMCVPVNNEVSIYAPILLWVCMFVLLFAGMARNKML